MDPEREAFEKQQLDAMREILRTAQRGFMCACCQKDKPKGEAAGVHLYHPEDPELIKAMVTARKVATYVICLECVDSVPDQIVHQKVTQYLASQGVFDPNEKPK